MLKKGARLSKQFSISAGRAAPLTRAHVDGNGCSNDMGSSSFHAEQRNNVWEQEEEERRVEDLGGERVRRRARPRREELQQSVLCTRR